MKLGCGNTVQTSLVVWRMEEQDLPHEKHRNSDDRSDLSNSRLGKVLRRSAVTRRHEISTVFFFKSLSPGTTLSLSSSLVLSRWLWLFWLLKSTVDAWRTESWKIPITEGAKLQVQGIAWRFGYCCNDHKPIFLIAYIFKMISYFRMVIVIDHVPSTCDWTVARVASKSLSNGKPNSRMTQNTAG